MQLHHEDYAFLSDFRLDIHLKIDAVTSCMSEYDEYQRYITKIK